MTEIDTYVENLGWLVRPYKVKVLALVRHLDQYNGEDRSRSTSPFQASTSSKQAIVPEKMPSTKSARSSNFEKALAQRALFGSRIKININGARLLSTSRMCKVSVADDESSDKVAYVGLYYNWKCLGFNFPGSLVASNVEID
ncbi:hypothetical protein DKX38_015873 [Salix brachista]|uniref:Uncharacterized protein n=1 Tax=Salix brachista TaxID=2182728 RepID=A0A5N5L6T5_9ROSI|nr:hypothetical protein DKX38_015873 [Salix brachista]